MKYWITGILGFSCTAAGIWLRLAASALAWPTDFWYSGPREDTVWAMREQAYQDIGLVILVFGLAVILFLLVNWLRSPASHTSAVP